MTEKLGARELIDRYGDAVLRLCRRITGNDADAEDARQESFLQLHRHCARLDPQGNPVGWLFRTAANAALRMRRERPAPPPPPDEPFLLDRGGDLEKIAAAIETLPADERALVVERFREGRTPAEIARRHGLPSGRVRVQLCRALQTLRDRVRSMP